MAWPLSEHSSGEARGHVNVRSWQSRGRKQGEASPFCVMGGPRLRGEDNQDWIAALHCVPLAMTQGGFYRP